MLRMFLTPPYPTPPYPIYKLTFINNLILNRKWSHLRLNLHSNHLILLRAHISSTYVYTVDKETKLGMPKLDKFQFLLKHLHSHLDLTVLKMCSFLISLFMKISFLFIFVKILLSQNDKTLIKIGFIWQFFCLQLSAILHYFCFPKKFFDRWIGIG